MEIWTAFVVGLFGSVHCLGMCGPIALALPQRDKAITNFAVGRLIYNLGRIVTYSMMGVLVGVIGQRINLAGYQQALSVTVGVVILIIVLAPQRFIGRLTPTGLFDAVFARLKQSWQKLFRAGSIPALLAIGILNGFLPCGLVYVALAGAATTGNIATGVAYMFVFGLGTLPAMLATSLAGGVVGSTFRRTLTRAIRPMIAVLAVLFIMRGMSLGIPYLSPRLSSVDQTTEPDCH
ncbi:MAG: sulfite exporter TauE/SafE family protein [Candidatus Zixiibacteriota bacterium]